jgi:hypothetical protein
MGSDLGAAAVKGKAGDSNVGAVFVRAMEPSARTGHAESDPPPAPHCAKETVPHSALLLIGGCAGESLSRQKRQTRPAAEAAALASEATFAAHLGCRGGDERPANLVCFAF